MPWLTRDQALAALGTKPQSLYASVSRGRVRTKADPVDPRRSLYSGDDVARLAQRAAGRRRTSAIAADAIRWGDPILDSAITTIAGQRPYYRGRDAIALAETASLEEVAALLWQADAVVLSTADTDPPADPEARALAARLCRDRRSRRDRLADARPRLAAAPGESATLVAVLADAVGAVPGAAPLHERLARGWGVADAAEPVRRALVLLADHELNASTFAARIAVSTGASLAAATLSGLATLTGPLHGAAVGSIMELHEMARSGGGHTAVRAWLARGHRLPGFGHPLYGGGDPRARDLLAHLDPSPDFVELAAAGRELAGEEPNIDFALAALADSYGLPPGAPLSLFAVARSVGWLAHAMEQNATGALIRPRARYIGPPVGA